MQTTDQLNRLEKGQGISASEQRGCILCATALFISFTAIYGISRNHSYTYDAVVFANTVENPITLLPRDVTFEWNHFLWYPTGRVFYLALHYVQIPLRGYEALQVLNALAGAAGVAITFLTLSRLATGLWGPFAWSIVSGFCASYWARSAGAENYLLGTFWAICFCYWLLSYWREPGDRQMAFMAICSVLSAYYHLGNVAMMIAAFLVVLVRRLRAGFPSQILSAALLLTILWMPYAYVHHWFELGGFSKWWIWSKGLADGYAPLQHPHGGFEWAIVKNSTATLQTFLKSVLWFESWNAATFVRLAALLSIGTLVIVYGRWKNSDRDPVQDQQARPGFVFLIPLGIATALYAVWQPWNPYYWSLHTALLCLFAGAISFRGRAGGIFSVQGVGLALLIAILGVQNSRALILPEKINPRQFVIDACLKIGQTIPVQSPVIMSGRAGEWGYMKVYLPYFGHRNRLAIDLFAINAIVQDRDPIAWMQEVIARHFAQGIPIFLMADSVSSKDAFSDFGLSPQQIESVWQPFDLRHIYDFPGNPPNKLYLITPPRPPVNMKD